MEKQGFMKALKCRECGREYPLAATHVCEFDFGRSKSAMTTTGSRKHDARGHRVAPATMWRYRELLPVASETDGRLRSRLHAADQADRLAARLGIPRTVD